jgi:hypothetical protein
VLAGDADLIGTLSSLRNATKASAAKIALEALYEAIIECGAFCQRASAPTPT